MPKWVLIGAILVFVAVLAGIIVRVIALSKANDVQQIQRSKAGTGSVGPTIDSLTGDETAEQRREREELARWRESLKLTPEEEMQRAQKQHEPDAPEKKAPARTVVEESVAVNALDADIKNAMASELTGRVSRSRTGEIVKAPVAQFPTNKTGELQGQQGGAWTPYLSSYQRQLIARNEADAKARQAGGSGGTASKPGDEEPQQQVFDVPVDQSSKSSDSAADAKVEEGVGMSVNFVAPYTIPIHCRLDQNVVVAMNGSGGSGSSSGSSDSGNSAGQRVVVTIDQDVVALNRVQIPRGEKLIGYVSGVHDQDMVDITFDQIQFKDLTNVSIKGRAYQPVTTIAPDDFGRLGLMGEYEEPDIPKKLMPVFLSVIQGMAKGNLERLAANGVTISGTTTVTATTTDRDRLFGGVSTGVDKIVTMMLEKLNRYSPRVRLRSGQPLVVLLDDYADISKRSRMGVMDPLRNRRTQGLNTTPATTGATGGESGKPAATSGPSAGGNTVGFGSSLLEDTPTTRAALTKYVQGLPADTQKALLEHAESSGK